MRSPARRLTRYMRLFAISDHAPAYALHSTLALGRCLGAERIDRIPRHRVAGALALLTDLDVVVTHRDHQIAVLAHHQPRGRGDLRRSLHAALLSHVTSLLQVLQ